MAPSLRVRLGAFCSLLSGALLFGHADIAAAKSSPRRTVQTHAPARKLAHTGTVAPHRTSATGHPAVRKRTQVAAAHVRPRTTTPRPSVPAQDLADLPVIVIDPGHGARDPGAVGVSGTPEKTITLAVALELRSRLDATGRYRTRLTRSHDRFVSLADRLDFARQNHADLVIAIHADASPDRRARGASVYVRTGQETSEQVAVATNGAAAGGAQTVMAGNVPREAGSARLQYSMIDQLADDVRMVASPARSGHLYVLSSRTMPSVLVETGFISNAQDEALLKQPRYRGRLVGAIADAVEDYFRGLGSGASRT